MAKGINKVILVGNLGQDPEVRYTQAGGAITNISIATTDSWTDKQSGQKQDRTEWHRVVFFNRLAEIAAEYLRKGSQVYVEGSLRTRKWQDQQGQERYTTEIVAAELQMLGGRGESSGVPRSDYAGARHDGPNGAPQYGSSTPSADTSSGYGMSNPGRGSYSSPPVQSKPNQQPAPPLDSFDDDIPF